MQSGAEESGFPVTHEIIDELGLWVQRLAALLPPAQQVRCGKGFRWEFRESTPLVLLVAKAVRMASGLRAAMLLAETGFVAECASLLRMVSDFATEAFAVAEGELRGRRTKAQQDFIDQFFGRKLTGPDEAPAKGKERYVGRDELMKAHVRLGNQAGIGGERIRTLKRRLNHGYDGYVHGAYSTAMELYHGDRHEFMLRGHEGLEQRQINQTAVAGKLHEVAEVLRLIALVAHNVDLQSDIRQSLARLEASREQHGPHGMGG